MNSLTRREKEHIKRDITKLEKDELIEVYKIISNSTDKISKNKNGVFINLKYIPDETLVQIRSFIQFRKDHNNQIQQNDKSDTISVLKPIVNSGSSVSSVNKVVKIESKLSSENDIGNKFCFQNFVEKLSINSHKLFPSEYGTKPQSNTQILKPHKVRFSNTMSRILKKCRDIHTLAPNEEYTDAYSNDGPEGSVSENLEKIRNAHKMHSITDETSTDSESSDETEDESEEQNIEDPKWDLDDSDDEKSFTSESS